MTGFVLQGHVYTEHTHIYIIYTKTFILDAINHN